MLVPLSPSAALFILLFYQNKVLGLPKSSSKLKNLAVDYVETDAKMIQQMVDMIFSFGGLGFQEIETSRYLVDILKKKPGPWFKRESQGCPLHLHRISRLTAYQKFFSVEIISSA